MFPDLRYRRNPYVRSLFPEPGPLIPDPWMFFVYRSNRVERLVSTLGEVLAADPAPPFEAETIIVQGRGMERWLAMQLSRRFGVWANPSFPFPRRYLLDVFARCLAVDRVDLSDFEPESLAWAIAARLPEHFDEPAFAELRRYVTGGPEADRLLSLAARIANTFDDYVVFRPRLIARWEHACDGSWESILWRRLVGDLGGNHVAAVAAEAVRRLSGGRPEWLPGRISIFGVSTLAPLYLEIFAALARSTDVHLYALSPSQEYWADLRSQRETALEWIRRDAEETPELEEALRLQEGNRLLASLGRVGREFQAVLEATVDYVEADEPLAYEEPGGGRPVRSALEQIQTDMLYLVQRTADSKTALAADDDSIAVHSAHGPMREVQILRDRLHAMFDADASLRPEDVVVMTPDIESYAPFVEAVFSESAAGRGVPYRIADRGARAGNSTFDALREVVATLQGRMTSADVIDLLRLPPIRRRFDLDDEDLEIVRRWVDDVEIRWGIDAESRRAIGRPAIDQNTWAFGLRRLFVGYAMGNDEDAVYGDTAPYPDIEGGDVESLGKLAEFCDRLFFHAARFAEERGVAEWRSAFGRLLDDLLAQAGAAAFEVQAIRGACEAIELRAKRAGFGGSVSLPDMADLIESQLHAASPARGFLSGAVTFCEMVPMRTIPFRVVCLIGLSDGSFPRIDRRPDFDRIGQRRMWGDRSRRDDDRYMFLEALLSARDKLYISYVGQSAHSQEDMPPSVVVQELLDAVRESFEGAGVEVCEHPLQAFSPRCFDGEDRRLLSYSRTAFEGARALSREPQAPPPFLTRPAVWEEEPIDLHDLVRFFENPSRAFLQRRLSIYLGRDVGAPSTREPVDLDPLERWKVADPMLRRVLQGRQCDFETIARFGQLPAGAIGRSIHEDLERTVREIAGDGHTAGGLAPLEVDLALAGYRVVGALSGLSEAGLTVFQYSTVGGRQEIALWIRHLVLCALRPDRAWQARLFGRSGRNGKVAEVVSFGAVSDPGTELAEILGLYRSGMEFPLPLFEKSSRAYAAAIAKGAADDAAARAAEKQFGDKGDLRDDYVRQLYGDACPFAVGHPQRADAARAARVAYARFLRERKAVAL